MNAEPTILDDWFLMEGREGTLVCTKASLPLVDGEIASARRDGADVVLSWSAGCCRIAGMGNAELEAGGEWMIGVVDLMGRPVAAMQVETQHA